MPARADAVLAPLPAGAPAPALALPALQGDVQAPFGRQPVLVHFFATWCAPCREELAALDRLARARPPGSPAILAIDVGEPVVRVRRFFAGKPPAFPVLIDEGRETMALWKVEVLPSTYLVDPGGRIAHVATGPVAWDDDAASRLLDALAAGRPVASTALPEAPPPPDSSSSGSEP
ncbi:TlpA disulfide reductase family protein [Ancylobacter lacus]|uniref:TlpA disulfide reductase family protein n=1 Tax=Ancylobacter lacus TaxID=2579970 RepID=UPI001BD0F1B8|nr:TlpA disulfide reductase family protein [Ancylobacter lacus]MBS7538392.1 TlpA family protein disulfide reductase [Ancylobacter lacus]